jgi:CubicO group peptidase (beta-lactamase class C family)
VTKPTAEPAKPPLSTVAPAPASRAAPDTGGAGTDLSPEQLAHLLARAKSLELPGEYVPPPGDALEHSTAGFAKTLCSAVFLSGLDPDDAAENVGWFTSPPEDRVHVVRRVVDRATESVHLTLASGVVRTARGCGSQGCVALPIGADDVYFTPSLVQPKLTDPGATPWPMGDLLDPNEPWPEGVDREGVARAVGAAFDPPDAMTCSFVVTHRGRIIGERYGEGVGMHTPLESWSMGKSVAGTLMGVLIRQGAYELWQPAPIPEWQSPGDPRQQIRIGDLMRMSSGLRSRAPQDPEYDPSIGYPDHLYLYTGPGSAFRWAATRPLEWPPGTVGRYRNVDPVLVNYLIRRAVEARGEDYHAFPQRNLFDRIGIRTMVLETDAYGNFLTQGYELASARDWARLGNLWLQKGVWMGERILPEGYFEYASTIAPAWALDGRPTYGGSHLWINGMDNFPVPRDALYMTGAGTQHTIIIPSHGLVVVRQGKYRGHEQGALAIRRALALLMKAVRPLATEATRA